MTELFWSLADAAFAAGWVVMLLCLFRLFFRKHLPRWLAVLMWSIVAVRLVCPISIESEMSPMPEPLSQAVFSYVEGTVESVESIPRDTVTAPDDAEVSAIEPTPSSPVISWETIACGVWLVGAIAMLGYMAVSYVLLQSSVHTAIKCEGNVYECETVDTPFILGVCHPRIYLPYRMSDADRRSALAHERAHIARGDHIWKSLAFLLLCVYWFNPLLWVAYILLCRDIEFACDEKVIKTLSKGERQTYSRALLSAAIGRRRITMCPLAFGEVGVEARVKGIKRYKKPALAVVAITVAACVVAAWWLMTDPPAPSRTTLENAQVCIYLEDENRSDVQSLLVETGNRVSLQGDHVQPIQFRIDAVDTEDMSVVLVANHTVYDGNKALDRLVVAIDAPLSVYTQKQEQGTRMDLSLALPSSVTSRNSKTESEIVYRANGVELSLYNEYFRLHFTEDPERDVCGVYEQTQDTLTLTQDAHLTQWVFCKQEDGVWSFDEASSYRHKKATAPEMEQGELLTMIYACEIEKVNQHYVYTVTDRKGNEVLSGYSAFGVKPAVHAMSSEMLKVTANVPASAPKMQYRLVDLVTGDVSNYMVQEGTP